MLNEYVESLLIILLQIVMVLVPLMISVAYLTLAERKVLGAMQMRKGANVVGFWGLLQPFSDALKLVFKETIVPYQANRNLFIIAPIITFTLSLSSWAVIPWGSGGVLSNLNVGILYVFALSSLEVYGVIIAGWASNSKYAFLGALRSAAQMVSYEVSIGLIIVTVLLCVGSLNLSQIVQAQENMWFIVPHFPMAVIYIISALAETNRTPFDLLEAEAELVSGFNTEYSSITFALFYLGEYANIILLCALGALLFLGGWLPPANLLIFTWVPGFAWFALKIAFLLFIFLWVRATLPRYRYDQLMRLGWKVFLPFSFLWVVLTAVTLLLMEGV